MSEVGDKRTEDGVKEHQRADNEDRAAVYRLWHRKALDNKCVMSDLDAVEWRYIDDQPCPIAVFELTRYDGRESPPNTYLASIVERFEHQGQGGLAKEAARLLGCEAWIVLFNNDCSRFWVYNLSNEEMNDWKPLKADRMVRWVGTVLLQRWLKDNATR